MSVLRLVALGLLLATPADPARAGESEIDRLTVLLELREGSRVADVGAGDGDWTLRLAEVVGANGHVYATEVTTELVDDLRGRVETASVDNITVILGSQTDTGLAASCCDAILLRMVYHHFQKPRAMQESLRRALRPHGLIAVIDINPQKHWRRLAGVPDRGGHGIEPQTLAREMAAAGFELVSQHEDWNGDGDRYCQVFRRLDSTFSPPAEEKGS